MTTINPISAISSSPAIAPGAVQGGAQTANSFGAYLKSAAAEAVNTMRIGEQAMIGGANGTLGVQDVVTAVTSAETTLQTVIAVRDKGFNAYAELLRMPV